MNEFKTALMLCGLADSEAAEYFGVSSDTAKGWSAERIEPPVEIWRKLAALYIKITVVTECALDNTNEPELDRKALSEFSEEYDGEQLPGHAEDTVAAMFKLGRQSV